MSPDVLQRRKGVGKLVKEARRCYLRGQVHLCRLAFVQGLRGKQSSAAGRVPLPSGRRRTAWGRIRLSCSLSLTASA